MHRAFDEEPRATVWGKALSHPREIDGLTAEEWLTNAVALTRSALDTDLSFFFVLDRLRKELTAYLSLDQEGEPRWQKMQCLLASQDP